MPTRGTNQVYQMLSLNIHLTGLLQRVCVSVCVCERVCVCESATPLHRNRRWKSPQCMLGIVYTQMACLLRSGTRMELYSKQLVIYNCFPRERAVEANRRGGGRLISIVFNQDAPFTFRLTQQCYLTFGWALTGMCTRAHTHTHTLPWSLQVDYVISVIVFDYCVDRWGCVYVHV